MSSDSDTGRDAHDRAGSRAVGYQSGGVPVAGPMDSYSHRLANRLVGNDSDAAALEITLVGPELDADEDVLCAVCGAFRHHGRWTAVAPDRPFELRKVSA